MINPGMKLIDVCLQPPAYPRLKVNRKYRMAHWLENSFYSKGNEQSNPKSDCDALGEGKRKEKAPA